MQSTFFGDLGFAFFVRPTCGSLSELILEDGFPAFLVFARSLLCLCLFTFLTSLAFLFFAESVLLFAFSTAFDRELAFEAFFGGETEAGREVDAALEGDSGWRLK